MAELLLFGSEVLELTETVFEMVEPSVTEVLTRTTSVKTDEPTAKLGFVQLIAPVPPCAGCVGQVHPAGAVIDLKVVFVGTVSERTALAAVSGPLLVAVIV